jgi:hypothetical protein
MSIYPQISDCVRTESNVVGIVKRIVGTTLYLDTKQGEVVCSMKKATIVPKGGYFYRYVRNSTMPPTS